MKSSVSNTFYGTLTVYLLVTWLPFSAAEAATEIKCSEQLKCHSLLSKYSYSPSNDCSTIKNLEDPASDVVNLGDIIPEDKTAIQDIEEMYGLKAVTLPCAPSTHKKPMPFGNFELDGVTFNYETLHSRFKQSRRGRHEMFYGKKVNPGADPLKIIQKYFTKGVARLNGHNDVSFHQGSVDGFFTSAFSIHTESLLMAESFSLSDGIIFIIDTTGSELLNLAEFNKNSGYDHEEEVLSRGGRDPEKIIGALLKDSFGRKPKLFLNPNYRPIERPAKDFTTAALRRFTNSAKLEDLHDNPTAKAWFEAIEYVEDINQRGRPPKLFDLSKVHAKAIEGLDLPYKGYYINSAAQIDKSLRTQFLAWVGQGRFDEISEKFNIDPPWDEELRAFGTLQFDSPVDPESKSDQTRYFTGEQIKRLKNNRFLSAEKIVAVAPNQFRAQFQFPRGENVERLLRLAFEKMNNARIIFETQVKQFKNIDHDTYEQKALVIAAEFYLSLVSIHPFWDGNGRTARLMRDWLLLYLGIPPPSYTPDNDLELSIDELVEHLKIGIAKTREDFPDGLLHLKRNKLK